MKRFFVMLLSVFVLFLGQSFKVNAGHTHTDACYQLQGAHSHTGNQKEGGKCYNTPVYHTHTGTETEGGGCYETPVYHNHAGDEKVGGECYQTSIYHTHTGNEKVGGNCYQTPVYHIHTGNSSQKGGCYTKENLCGGTIASEKVSMDCQVYHSAYLGKTTWPCACGGTVTQEGYWVSPTGTCEADHGAYYEVSCNMCGEKSTRGFKGMHVGYRTTYYCSTCKTPYNASGKCTKVKSYSLNCGKTTTTIEKYNLSCKKTKDSIESYKLSCLKTSKNVDSYLLSCKKTGETIENYELSCKEKESAGKKVLICKEKETPEVSGKQDTPSQPAAPSQSTSSSQPSTSNQSTGSIQATTPNIQTIPSTPNVQNSQTIPSTPNVQNMQTIPNTSDTSDISKKSSKSESDIKESQSSENKSNESNENLTEDVKENITFADFEVECGLMVDGVWVKLLPVPEENLADEPYSFDGGQNFDTDNKNIYSKDGIYYVAVKTKNGGIKAKRIEICMRDKDYACVTEYKEFLTVEEYKESIEQEEIPIKNEVNVEKAYTLAENIKEESVLVLEEAGEIQESVEKSTKASLSETSKMISLAVLICSSGFFVAGFCLKKKKN